MNVFIVLEEVQYDYDGGRTYKNVYGVYKDKSLAQKAIKECESQVGGKYYAYLEEMELVEK